MNVTPGVECEVIFLDCYPKKCAVILDTVIHMYCVTVDALYISGEEFVIEWHNVVLHRQVTGEFT